MLRKIVFWLHLIAGILAGIVILIMSITGVLLTYEKQIVAWADRGYLFETSTPGAPRVPAEAIAATIRKASGTVPTTLTFYAGSAAASAAGGGSTYFVNAYTGELLGVSSPRVRAFFRSVTDWHRYLAMSGDQRPTGKAITGTANFVFFFLVISGAFIWWRGAFAWFKKGLKGKALYWSWHHVFGVWALIPLALIVLSGMVISYPWASDLVYKLAGSEPPAQGGAGGRNGNRGTSADLDLKGVDDAIVRVEQSVPGWKTIALRLPPDKQAPLGFTVDRRNAGQPQFRSTVTVDRKTSQIVRIEKFEDQNAGRKTRSWLRFVHTGEFYGAAGQTVAGIASLGGVMLVWTGFALSLHRFAAWMKGRKRQTSATMNGLINLPEER